MPRALLTAIALSAVLAALSAVALDGVAVSLRHLTGDGFRVGAVAVAVDGLEGETQALVFELDDLVLPAPLGGIAKATVRCAQGRVDADRVRCRGGRAELVWDLLDRPSMQLDLDARLDGGRFELDARDVRLAGGRADLGVTRDGEAWHLRVAARDLDPVAAETIAARFGVGVGRAWASSAGRVRLDLDVSGRGDVPERARGTLAIDALSGGNEAGTLATDAAALQIEGEVTWRDARPAIDARARLTRGQFYVDPVFVELGADGADGATPDTAIEIALRGRRVADGWQLDALRFTDPGRVAMTASGRLDAEGGPRELKVEVTSLALGPGYRRYLQPLLLDSAFAELDLAGSLQGAAELDAQGLRALRVAAPRVDLDDREGRFGFYGLRAQVDWRRDRRQASTVAWQSGHVLGLDLGAIDWTVDADGQGVALRAPARLPVLDGALQIDALAVTGLDATPGGRLAGFLEPISMRALSHAFGWPSMEGKLSGMIPGIRYDNARLGVDGVLLMRLFDGEITLRDLVVRDPFGVAPVLRGEVEMRGLDLDALTRTFAFGNIQGRLDGWVRGLRMVAWQPVAFDAGFMTPADDDSRHRISQKAVDNLTSLGGVSGALSRSFMRFFETFGYDRLGMTCRLHNEVCEMGGVLPAGDGSSYYIVKGGGLPPRIDVVGYSRQVDWPTLLDRLQRITREGGPEIR